jgi:hypothetical protein
MVGSRWRSSSTSLMVNPSRRKVSWYFTNRLGYSSTPSSASSYRGNQQVFLNHKLKIKKRIFKI